MKNTLFFFLIIIFLFSACSDDSEPLQACKTENVLEDLPWLNDVIEEQEQSFIGRNYSFISTGQYKLKTVFILQNCCPNCSSLPPSVYDCSGNILGYLGSEGIEFDKVKNYEVIWKSSENSCGFSE